MNNSKSSNVRKAIGMYAYLLLYSEEVGHAYGCARNSVSRMVSKHCEISVATALEAHLGN